MVMSVNIPLFLYTFPFIIAAGVLICAQIEKLRPTPDVDDKPVMTRDDALVEELRPEPLRRRYISYTI